MGGDGMSGGMGPYWGGCRMPGWDESEMYDPYDPWMSLCGGCNQPFGGRFDRYYDSGPRMGAGPLTPYRNYSLGGPST